MNRIPFTLPDDGLRELKGLVYIDEGFLIVKVESSLFGLLDKQKETVKIEAGALEDLRIKRGPFKDRLVIRPLGVELLDAIPGNHIDEVILRVNKWQHAKLKDLVQKFWSI